jgi:hypothetical protein
MTKIRTPQHLPITKDLYKKEQYDAVPQKVTDVLNNEPTHIRKVWNEVAADGYISLRDADRLNHAMGDLRIFGREIVDGTDTVEAKFIAMRMAEGKVEIDPKVRQMWETELADRQACMQKGEILSGTFHQGDSIHQLTEGIVDMPFEQFMQLMPADRWAVNLADYRGGEVKVTEHDAEGRIVRQRERMVTETPLSKIIPGLFEPNDMTKVESIHYDANSAVVKWEVLDSDNKTTLKDIGEVRFIRMGNQTKIEFESEHRIDTFPGVLRLLENFSPLDRPYKNATSAVMRGYFSDCIRHYQHIAANKAPSR